MIGPRRIFTTKPIEPDEESYFVHFGRLGRKAWLCVENLGNVTGRSPGKLINLDVVPVLYLGKENIWLQYIILQNNFYYHVIANSLGGHNSKNFSTLPHDLPLHTGFAGCIFDVTFKSGDVTVPLDSTKRATGRAVGQCGTTECHENICHNKGACLHHGATFT